MTTRPALLSLMMLPVALLALATPVLADLIGWPGVFLIMAVGPALGIVAMLRLKAISK